MAGSNDTQDELGARDLDPALEEMVRTLAREPRQAVLVRGYPYREAILRRDPDRHDNAVDIQAVMGLWQHLSDTAGWRQRNNHSVFVFEYEGQRHAVWFHDYTAHFGREEEVWETTR